MAVDLHLHSRRSDGSDEPADVVAKAVAARLTAMALTDHDNLRGIEEARAAAAEHGIAFIPGTELSVNWRNRAMHMLVYFLEPGAGPLVEALGSLQDAREDRNHVMVERLRDLNIAVTYEEIAEEAGGMGVGRPHFAAVLVRKGYVDSIQDAFDRYLATGRRAYVPRARLDAEDAIQLARQSAAVPVVAHPHTVGVSKEEYETAFRDLVDAGLGGIEAYYGEYEPPLRAHLADLCDALGIAATGGSDYHGTYKPGLAIGTARGDLAVPDETVDQLEEQRGA